MNNPNIGLYIYVGVLALLPLLIIYGVIAEQVAKNNFNSSSDEQNRKLGRSSRRMEQINKVKTYIRMGQEKIKKSKENILRRISKTYAAKHISPINYKKKKNSV